jgi:hypothetical protein
MTRITGLFVLWALTALFVYFAGHSELNHTSNCVAVQDGQGYTPSIDPRVKLTQKKIIV